MAGDAYRPSGPVDPVAAQIGEFFAANPVWQNMASTPMAETRAAFRENTPVSGLPALKHVEDFTIPVKAGEIRLRLYRPDSAPTALIVWAHGGGFALGSIDEIDNFSRQLTAQTGCAVVSVEYRLAPEYPFPTPVEDMVAAVQWVCARSAELAGADVPVFVGGDSAGANLATVATRKLHEAGSCRIAGNILAYPSTDNSDAASLATFVPPFLVAGDVKFFLQQYQPDPARNADSDFAPLYARDVSGLPPTLLLTAEHDIITDQAEAYGRKLADAGVAVSAIRYPGMIHGFVTMDFFFEGAAGQAIGDIGQFVAKVAGAELR